MFDTLHRTRNVSTDPLGHFMFDAMRMNVDNRAADDGPYDPQLPMTFGSGDLDKA